MRVITKQILIAVIFFILGAIIAYNIPKPRAKIPININNRVVAVPNLLIDKYFPIQKGDFWEYEGVKKEDVGNGKIETSNIKKRMEVVDIQETSDGKLVTLGGFESFKILIKDSTIDFNPDIAPEAKFVWTFPLYVGQRFGNEEDLRNREDNLYVELVEEKITEEVMGKKYDECFKVIYTGVPDTSYKVFCYGLGIIEEGYKHNGTVLEWNYKLTASNII